MVNKNGSQDPLVVRCEDLRKILLPIIEEHDKAREDWIKSGESDEIKDKSWTMPWQKVGRSREDLTRGPVSGATYIAHVVGVDPRRIYIVMRLEQKHVSYTTAEQWLLALGLPHELSHLPTYPNPQWSQEKWINYMSERGCI